MRRCWMLVALSACDLVFPLTGPAGDASTTDGGGEVVGCSAISMLADDFTDGTQNWETFTTGTGGLDFNQQAVRFVGANGGDRATLTARHYFDLRDGAFTLEVSPQVGPPVDSSFELLLIGRAPFGRPNPRVGFSITNDGMGNRVLRGFHAESGEFTKFSINPLTADHAVWRLARNGDTIEWWTAPSVDGTFTLRGTEVLPAVDFVLAELRHVNDAGGGGSFDVLVDNVNGGVPSGDACPMSALSDTFPGPDIDPQWSASTAINCTMTPGNGVEIVPTPGGYDCSLRSATIYDLRGREIRVELEKLSGVAGQDFDLQLNVDIGTLAFQVRDGLLAAIGALTGQTTQTYGGNIPFSLTTHRSLRIREEGGMVIWETSNGGSFVLFANTSDFASSMNRVEVQISLTGNPLESAKLRRVN